MYVRFINIIEMEGYGSRKGGFCLYHSFWLYILPCINANMIEKWGKNCQSTLIVTFICKVLRNYMQRIC